MLETAERVNSQYEANNYVFNRQLKAYELAKEMVSGKILELGSGEGYGIDLLSPKADIYQAVDKFDTTIDFDKNKNVRFTKLTIPPLSGIQDNSYDFVVAFQLIEHIEEDRDLVKEINRVLVKGGKFIVTTPNIKTTLSRNPWHIREYTKEELHELLKSSFHKVETLGIFGDVLVDEYYQENKRSVDRIMKYDIFNLQYRLPRSVLKIPFDILNHLNRKKNPSKIK